MEYTGSHKYNDIKFFLVAIAFISAFNYYLTYSNIKLNWFLLLTYTIDTLQGWLAWWAVRTIILYLDNKLSFTNQPIRRICIQLIVTTIAGLFVIISLTELVSLIARRRFVPISFYTFDVFIFIIWFFVLNGIYIGMHYYAEWKESERLRIEEKKVRAGGLSVKQGKQNLLIPFHEIMGFYSEEGYSVMLTTDAKKYFPDKSLEKIEETVPLEFFFRVNRQYMIHRNAISGFKRAADGKLDVIINGVNNFPNTLQVSRIKAAKFKNWFHQT